MSYCKVECFLLRSDQVGLTCTSSQPRNEPACLHGRMRLPCSLLLLPCSSSHGCFVHRRRQRGFVPNHSFILYTQPIRVLRSCTSGIALTCSIGCFYSIIKPYVCGRIELPTPRLPEQGPSASSSCPKLQEGTM
jgi:hypothetical protein